MSSGFENHKGTDQPAHSCSMISTFAIRLLSPEYASVDIKGWGIDSVCNNQQWINNNRTTALERTVA